MQGVAIDTGSITVISYFCIPLCHCNQHVSKDDKSVTPTAARTWFVKLCYAKKAIEKRTSTRISLKRQTGKDRSNTNQRGQNTTRSVVGLFARRGGTLQRNSR